ncbi:hypothetical protein H6P81_019931 [Aristolochia fimbriata]|uniref:Purple acid phosphatase n=1 Tax=Aristolochia fimbriata TaxID=158543 RepID=A0AAV7DWB4_ARIFI|nr:hypothetical protein H6P81_019931 [Aristolochia fimbriata]
MTSYLYVFLPLLTIMPACYSSVSISVTPRALHKSGDTVRIEWTGIESPSSLDWLGIYSPPDSEDDDFIGYKFLSSCSDWKSGSCSVDLPLVNLRSSYQFRIFRWTEQEVDPSRLDHDHNPLPGAKHLLAKSADLGFSTKGPEQIHLSFTDREDEMRVMFIADDRSERFVKYGKDKDGLKWNARAEVTRYERSDMCDSPANASGWRDPGFIHDAVMKNLKKGKRYYYMVGSDAGGWSEIHSFISRNQDSDETYAFLFGDMGTWLPYSTFLRLQEESVATVKWILRDIEALDDTPSFISHIGDISYARGYSWLWDAYFNQIEPLASKVPFHVCIGNHEYDWPLQPWRPAWATSIYGTDGGGECGVPYSLKFKMPGNSSFSTGTNAPDTKNLYYSFDEGVVHFVYFSTETNFLPGSDQYNFIKNDLEKVDRKKTSFVVFQGHRPMYTTGNEGRDGPLRMKLVEHLEPLLVENKVDLVLWGHVHRYERFCPMKNFTCGEEGSPEAFPVHVVIGMGGQDWQAPWAPRRDHPQDPIFPQPSQSLYRAGEFGYTRLVATREKLTLTYVGNHDGEPHDVVEILSEAGIQSGRNVGSALSPFSWYVKGASVVVLGVFVGYIFGFISHSRRQASSRGSWIAVKTELE